MAGAVIVLHFSRSFTAVAHSFPAISSVAVIAGNGISGRVCLVIGRRLEVSGSPSGEAIMDGRDCRST